MFKIYPEILLNKIYIIYFNIILGHSGHFFSVFPKSVLTSPYSRGGFRKNSIFLP